MKTRTDLVGSTVTKTVSARITKVDSGEESGGPGGFEAIVAVFGNIDSQGDKVAPGAFTESIAAKGETPFPSLWSHDFYDPDAFIASATAEETSEGLLWKATFRSTEFAQKVRALMAEGLVDEFSWSGRVTEGGWIDAEGEGPWGDGYYEIRKVDFWEAGPCFKGANGETELLGIKSGVDRLATKEGRVLAQTHVDTLKTIRESLDGVITAVEKVADEEEEKTAEKAADIPAEPAGSGDTTSVRRITRARLALS